MSKSDFIRHFFAGLVLVAFIAGCSKTHNRTSTGEYTDDASISDEIIAGLFDDPAMREFQIKVESFKGFVQLSGFVDSVQASGRATEIANSVRGVKYVKNGIVIKKWDKINILITVMIVLPEKQNDLLQTLLSLIEPQGKENGCLSYGIYSNIEDSHVFSLISEWETRKHLDDYMMSARFNVLLGTTSLLCKPIEIRIFKVLDSEGVEVINSAKKKMKLIYPVLTHKGA